MIIMASGKQLYKLFTDFVGNNKVMFNFMTDGNNLRVQMLDDYTVGTGIDCTSVDNDHNKMDVSFWVTKAVLVMDKDEDVKITFSSSTVLLEQKEFYCMFTVEYEARREYPSMAGVELKPALANNLKAVTHDVQACVPIAKELSIVPPDPMFVNGNVYSGFNQCFLISRLSYPEMCITYNTLKSFAYKLKEDTTYAYLKEYNVLYLLSGRYEFWIPTVDYNIDGATISSVDRKLADMYPITTIKLEGLIEKFQIITSAFAKQQLAMVIGVNEIAINADSSHAHVTTGGITKYLVSIRITPAELLTITKIFSDDEEIEVLRGGNGICLRNKNKSFVIAGVPY